MTQQQTVFCLKVIIFQLRRQWGEVVLLQTVPVRIRFWSLTVAIALIIAFPIIVQDTLKQTVLGYSTASACILKVVESQLRAGLRVPPIEGQTEPGSLHFHHANSRPFVLEDGRFSVESGKVATIAEPSDRKKTTLIKLTSRPRKAASEGRPFDDFSRSIVEACAHPEEAAAIEQDDQLSSGAIFGNICFYNSTFNLDWMIQCARPASTDDDIMAMPMTSWLALAETDASGLQRG